MKAITKLTGILLVATILFTGCSLTDGGNAPQSSATPQVQEEDVVICRVGERTILRSQFEHIFSFYEQMYGQYFSDETFLHQLQDMVFENLVQAEVINLQAELQGLTLTAEEEQAIQDQLDTEYESLLSIFRQRGEQEGVQDVEAYALEAMEQALANQGTSTSQYFETLEKDLRKVQLMEKLQQPIYSGITLSEEEALAQFQQDLEEQTKRYMETPSQFQADQENFEKSGGIPPLYVPEGFRRVKHILIKSADGVDALAISNDLYTQLTEEEADFDALMEEYGEDGGMQVEPNKSMGYLMNKDTSFVPEFLEAALNLEHVGDITEPVKTDYGYHIIKLVSLLPSGPKTFEELKDVYMEGLLSQRQSAAFQEAVAQWREETDVESHVDLIRDIGAVE